MDERRYLMAGFAVALGVLLFAPLWAYYGMLIPEMGEHGGGGSEVRPEAFKAAVEGFVERHGLPDGAVQGVPEEPGLLEVGQYYWRPATVRLRTGETYTFHISSVDVVHAFSLNMGSGSYNAVVMPYTVTMVRVTPLRPGEYLVYCSEYCGIGHDLMKGKIIVEGEPVPGQEPVREEGHHGH